MRRRNATKVLKTRGKQAVTIAWKQEEVLEVEVKEEGERGGGRDGEQEVRMWRGRNININLF